MNAIFLQCEEELTSLRDQLAQTQKHLAQTQQRLMDEERHRTKVRVGCAATLIARSNFQLIYC